MPHALSLYDGSTTLSLSTGSYILGHYVPQAPKEGKPVTEPVELTVVAASTGAVQTAINDVERLFEKAKRRAETGKGPKVFLQYQPTGDGTVWRSELVDARLELTPTAMRVWSQAKVGVRLFITRAPFWEGARTQIPLSNNNGSNNTSGLTIWNHDDSGSGNDDYVEFAGSNVTGVLPTPLELQLANASGASQNYRNFFVGNNNFDNTAALTLEGENRQAGYGTATAASGTSNGQYLALSVNGTFVVPWTLSSLLLQQAAGRYLRVLGVFHSFAAPGVYVRAAIRDYYGLVTLARTNEIMLTPNASRVQDLGILPFPPGGYNPGWGSQTLVLEFRTSSLQTVGLDFLLLMPSEPLCFQRVVQRSMTVLSGSTVVLDGIENLYYLDESGPDHPIYAPKGMPVHVFPGVTQRLYILHDGTDRSVDWKLTVKAWYRPRRLTV